MDPELVNVGMIVNQEYNFFKYELMNEKSSLTQETNKVI